MSKIYYGLLVIVAYINEVPVVSSTQLDLKQSLNLKRSPEPEAHPAYGASGKEAAVLSAGVEQLAYPHQQQQQYYQSKAPTKYSNSIPAAAIRNVETITITKTITPVITKITTYKTHSEPALSIGHAQGHSHSSVGQSKVAPVTFLTQYMNYANPTVGVNGPVTYTGPAVNAGPNDVNAGHLLTVDSSEGLIESGGGGSEIDGIYSKYSSPGTSPLGSIEVSGPSTSYGAEEISKDPISTYGAPHGNGEPIGSYSIKQLSEMGPPLSVPAAPFHTIPKHTKVQSDYSLRQSQYSQISAASLRQPQYSQNSAASLRQSQYLQISAASLRQPQYLQISAALLRQPKYSQNSAASLRQPQYLQISAASLRQPKYLQNSAASLHQPQQISVTKIRQQQHPPESFRFPQSLKIQNNSKAASKRPQYSTAHASFYQSPYTLVPVNSINQPSQYFRSKMPTGVSNHRSQYNVQSEASEQKPRYVQRQAPAPAKNQRPHYIRVSKAATEERPLYFQLQLPV